MHPHSTHLATAGYAGLRMTADGFFAIPDDGFRYELVDGIVVMNPSPTLRHQAAAAELTHQLVAYSRENPIARVFPEVDVRLTDQLVYRPDLVVIRRDRLRDLGERVRFAPDLAVEILSGSSRRYDQQTKRRDYALHGVSEYWIVDPHHRRHEFLRLQDGAYIAIPLHDRRVESAAFPGLTLDLAALHRSLDL